MKQVYGVWLPESDTHFEKHMNEDGSYQRDTFRAAMEHVKEPKIFYDIGAHVGLWSLMAHKAGFKHIEAYEPNPATFTCLVKNLEGKVKSLFLNPHGISASAKHIKIAVQSPENSGAVILAEDIDSDSISFPINNNSLHEYIDHFQIKAHETLVKIDTEGMEAECVEGMDKILYAYRPVVCVEQRSNTNALNILQQMGMQIVNQVRKDYILTWKNL